MDRMIYTAMSGAKHILEQQATNSHNLANASTDGFRQQLNSFRAVPVQGEGLKTRAMVVDSTIGTDFTPGPIQTTGRTLDVAVETPGFISVTRPDGTEAYTRNGALNMTENGTLITNTGYEVMGEGGPIAIPPNANLTIGKDGTLSVIPADQPNAPANIIGRLKLVNPLEDEMERGADGLFTLRDGRVADADGNVRVLSGAIEGSNVNIVESMVNMINLARQFEQTTKLIEMAKSNEDKASSLLNVRG